MNTGVAKLPTGIPGLDLITKGGLPDGRTTLVAGTAGSGKTVFAAQFLAEGIREGQPGLFLSFEEPPREIRANVAGFGWDLPQWEADGKWVFIDASLQPDEVRIEAGAYDLTALILRVEHAIRKVGAKRVAIDSIGAVFAQFGDATIVRAELMRLNAALRKLGVTTVVTAERREDYGEISRFGVEEFVSDNVIILRNVLEQEKRRRTVEILKFRGTDHQKGEFPFSVLPGSGIAVIPLSAISLHQRSSTVRVSSGNRELDAMCGGGFFRDSVILISGATGTGKTLMTTEFLGAGFKAREKALIFAFEESRDQLFRNAAGWGHDFEALEREGLLRVVCEYPESLPIEDHLLRIKREFETFRPARVAVDSLSALERVATEKSFREFVIGLTSYIKEMEVTGVVTSTTASLTGGTTITEAHISTITDTIILLRYVELFGEMRRGLTVLKMRGSMHDKDIREFNIDGKGLHLGNPFRTVGGILAGRPTQLGTREEIERMRGLFQEP